MGSFKGSHSPLLVNSGDDLYSPKHLRRSTLSQARIWDVSCVGLGFGPKELTAGPLLGVLTWLALWKLVVADSNSLLAPVEHLKQGRALALLPPCLINNIN